MKTMLRHVYEIYVRATPEKIWQAITSGELSRQYFWGCAVESDFTVDSPLRYIANGEVMVHGTVLELHPPRKLVHTFEDHAASLETANDAPSRVTWEIEPLGEECRVTLTHDGFESPTATYIRVENGWPPILSGLKTLVESDRALSIAWPEDTDIRNKKPDVSGRAQVYQLYVRATPERVWEAITQPDETDAWFTQRLLADEWRAGGALRFADEDGIMIDGVFLEINKPYRLSYSFKDRWNKEAADERPSRVTWELTPMGDSTRIVLMHDDFPEKSRTFDDVARGWPKLISHLKTYLETGQRASAQSSN